MSKTKSSKIEEFKPRKMSTGFKMKKADKILTRGIRSLIKAFNMATISGLHNVEYDKKKPKNESKKEKKRGNKVMKMRKQ